jgi:hypothetical protein
MTDRARRQELRRQADEQVQCGVYRIRSRVDGRGLLATTRNLASARHRFEFAFSTRSPAALDHRLRPLVEEQGFEALEFEVLDVLTIRPGMTEDEIRSDLAALEELWREKAGR